MRCCWIPPLLEKEEDQGWGEYDAQVYGVFKRDFIDSRPTYHGKPVKIRYQPIYDDRAEAYWHLTCRDYNHKSGLPEDRSPDLERCRRIKWPRAFIENSDKCPEDGNGCKGVMVWKAEHRSRRSRKSVQSAYRIKFYLEEENYLVVLEPRKNYCLLITAYYIDEPYGRKSIKREMARCGAKKAGGAVWAPPEGSFTHTVDELT